MSKLLSTSFRLYFEAAHGIAADRHPDQESVQMAYSAWESQQLSISKLLSVRVIVRQSLSTLYLEDPNDREVIRHAIDMLEIGYDSRSGK